MIREGTIKLVDGNDLTAQETTEIMNEVMSGRATNIETASFLTAQQAKGATNMQMRLRETEIYWKLSVRAVISPLLLIFPQRPPLLPLREVAA